VAKVQGGVIVVVGLVAGGLPLQGLIVGRVDDLVEERQLYGKHEKELPASITFHGDWHLGRAFHDDLVPDW
jgi:hypothetical protein